MLKIAICDDEKNVCDYIEKRTRDYLAKIDEEAELAVFLDGTPLIDHCKESPKDFDIIFLDPPYNKDLIEKALGTAAEYGILSEDGIIVLESDSGDFRGEIAGFSVYRQKKYGRTYITIYRSIQNNENCNLSGQL